jgi:hypothetical protein
VGRRKGEIGNMYGNFSRGIAAGIGGAVIPAATLTNIPWMIIAAMSAVSVTLAVGSMLPKWRRSGAR